MTKTVCSCGGVKDKDGCKRCGRKGTEDRRKSSTKRGYDRQWANFVARYRKTHPLCHDCNRPTEEIHHRIKLRDRPDLKYEPTNLLPLCRPCHSVRTARGE